MIHPSGTYRCFMSPVPNCYQSTRTVHSYVAGCCLLRSVSCCNEFIIIINIIIIQSTRTVHSYVAGCCLLRSVSCCNEFIIIINIINIIALKGAIGDFYNLLTAPRTVSNTNAHVARALLCANHAQHIEHLSRAACRVPRSRKGQLTY